MNNTSVSAQIGKIILSEEQIRTSVCRLARQIKKAYKESETVIAIVLMAGAKQFADDLFCEISSDKFEVEYIRASSYNGGIKSNGRVDIKDRIRADIAGQDVLIIDDIYETGLTLKRVVENIREKQPSDVKTCVLLEKQIKHEEDIEIDFVGVQVPDCFLVGYGLDYEGQLRELPFIAAMDVENQC